MVALLFRFNCCYHQGNNSLLVGDSLKPCYGQDVMRNSPFQSPLIFFLQLRRENLVSHRDDTLQLIHVSLSFLINCVTDTV